VGVRAILARCWFRSPLQYTHTHSLSLSLSLSHSLTRSLSFVPGTTIIGSADSADVNLNGPLLQGEHCVLEAVSDAQVLLHVKENALLFHNGEDL
jgi:hypothetical protein